jgi:glycyl-tRNA synthetase beta chain
MSKADLLIEIGTEELPPKALRTLMTAFGENVTAAIDEERLAHGAVHTYASPRRLAVVVEKLASGQEDRSVVQKGPPVSVAFDGDGNLTPAGAAFAKKCGVDAAQLGRSKTDKGEWLSHEATECGKLIDELLPALIEKALASLPIPRRMRWGAGDAEFVRPVHWVVLLHGSEVIAANILGIDSGSKSRGHRFHSSGPIEIKDASSYVKTLESDGYVIADFERRRQMVVAGVTAAAAKAGGVVVDGESLFDEVASLVEWPVPITGGFDADFLRLPREVVVSTLTGHQRYFPVADESGALLPTFITVANLESSAPDKVRDGNERVIRPRLADAAFFWDNDRRLALAGRQDGLREVVYQHGLGSVFDKSMRVSALVAQMAEALELDASNVQRAAELSKCDLITGMVGEFPELQGTMGGYYATSDGETQAVADAIAEHYRPRFSGDALPASVDGRLLAVADKLDTLAGIFVIGKKPSGNRDPFGLRRNALGIVRLLIECDLDLDLHALIAAAIDLQPQGKGDQEPLPDELYTFITERLRRYFLDRDSGLAAETFDAVLSRRPTSLVDFDRRLRAVQSFIKLEPAASLAAANKRIANILRRAESDDTVEVSEKLLSEPAEIALWTELQSARGSVQPLLDERDYSAALNALSELRDPVDVFFDDVMVMADDEAIRNNRLALLGELRALFLHVADISRLSL